MALTWRHPQLRAIALCSAGADTVYVGLLFAVVVVARGEGASSLSIGVMLAAIGVGGLLRAVVAVRLIAALPPGALLLGVLWTGAIAIPVMAVHPVPVVIGPLLAGLVALLPAANTVLVSRQMTVTPEDMQGRVFSSMVFLSGAGGALAPALVGLLIEALGGPAAGGARGGDGRGGRCVDGKLSTAAAVTVIPRRVGWPRPDRTGNGRGAAALGAGDQVSAKRNELIWLSQARLFGPVFGMIRCAFPRQ